MKNRQASLAYLFGERQKAASSEFDTQSGGLVIAAPGHMVQFYEDEAFLHDTLREFVGTGLHAGHACIVIATKEHIRELEGQLANSISHSVNTGKGHYIALDAGETLAKIMVGNYPDWDRFLDVVGSVIAAAGKNGRIVRAFGEMVDLLWQDSKPEAALQLEQFWNDLSAIHPFFLYCAYPMHRFGDNTNDSLFAKIGKSHTHILPAESYSAHGPGAPQKRAIVELQQKALSLQTEITRHRRTEEALRLSEMRYRRLFETAIDGILLVDSSTYDIIDANPYAAKLLDCEKDQLVGKNIFTIRPFTQNKSVKDQFNKLPMDQRLRYEAGLETGSGKRNEIEIIATPYSEGLAPIIQLSLRDITERKKAEQLEVRATGLLAEREHLMELNVAKDEFISLASHQLRTPATGVKQYIGMLLQGFMGDISDMQRIGLEKAYESNERQLKIVNDLLLVARVDAGKVVLTKAPCDIVQLIRDVASEQQDEIQARHQRIQLRLPKTLTAAVDARFLRMVLENLVNNASKYSDDGLPISITVRHRERMVCISVKDKGVGIRKNDLPKLYQKFSRIYNDRSTVVDGTGLGLYWSKKIIELHDGELQVKSKVNEGSVFSITLPQE